MTTYWHLALLYVIGVYTATEQGILRKGTYFARFWKHHYFDWMLLFRRGFKYAGIGGFITGTLLFGDWYLAGCLLKSKYQLYFRMRSYKPSDVEYSEFTKIY
mmetsp:Transcript_8469/g.14229  ORF Transcript_8469/g.14229 Transcript_8469/m.14229 type:complete len:102 (-) Transcript_8469:82-387(-)